jgi:lipopolysaccharide export LptBFGC system permease protein LptF
MSKAFLSLLFVCVTVIQANNLIPWNASRKLTWNDFKGDPDPHTSNAALTSSNINIEFGYDETGFQYSISCNFDKNRSWVRIKNNEVLAHEQGHFDLAEIYARKLNKTLKAYHFNAKTASKDINQLYEDAMKQHRLTQTQYDQETDFSRNRPKQEEWLAKIEQQLKETAPFANYHDQAGN